MEFLSLWGGQVDAISSIPIDIKVLYLEQLHRTKSPVKLLHYGPGVGSLEAKLKRYAQISKRIRQNSWMVELTMGAQYLDNGRLLRLRREQLKQAATVIHGVSTKHCY